MGMLVGALGALSVFYDDESDFGTEEAQRRHICRLIGNIVTIGCCGASQQCGPALCVIKSRVGFLRQFFEYVIWHGGRGLSG